MVPDTRSRHPSVREDRIAGGLTAFACGDALGVPWEGRPPTGARVDEVEALPAAGEWPRGATSDDTALTLLAAEHLIARDGSVDPEAFLATLVDRAPAIRGLGPSTLAAIGGYAETGQLPTRGGDTNGAAMRALPLGWATAPADSARRRRLTMDLSRATHPAGDAQVAACVVATCGSWVLEGSGGRALLQAAIDEAGAAAEACGTPPRLAAQLRRLAAGEWTPPPDGIGLDPTETVVAALSCVLVATSLRQALIDAVALGGDTDTVAALVGGLLGSTMSRARVLAELPWHTAVSLPPQATILGTARALARLQDRG